MRICLLTILAASLAAPARAQSAAGSAKPAEKTVTIEVRAADVADVLRQLFELAGEKGVLGDVESTGRKLTALMQNVPFENALSLIANAAGLKAEKKNGAWVVTLPGPQGPVAALTYGPGGLGSGVGSTTGTGVGGTTRSSLGLTSRGELSALTTSVLNAFRCASCEKTLQIVTPRPRTTGCVKCGQALQSEWEFCPGCGEKKATPEEVSFCPFCGKSVKSGAPRPVTAAELEAARARVEIATTQVARARERLARSQGKLLREQNQSALTRAEAELAAARAELQKLEASRN